MCHIFIIYSSLDGKLGYFHFLATVRELVTNTGVQLSLWKAVEFSGYVSDLEFYCWKETS